MTKIQVTLYETSTHVVEIETPAFFKLKEGDFTKYFHIFESEPGIHHAHCVIFYKNELWGVYPDRTIDKDTTSGVIIDPKEFWNAIGNAYDIIGKLMNNVSDIFETTETEEGRELDEAEIAFIKSLDRADAYNDEQKYKSFEAQNFNQLTKIPV